MSNLFLSGFDACVNASDFTVLGFSGNSGNVSFETGLLGDGKSLRVGAGNAGDQCRFTFSSAQDGLTLTIGFRYKTIVGFSPATMLYILDSGLSLQCYIAINAAGKIELKNNTTLLATSTTSVNDGAARYIEWEILVGNAGSSKLRINGNQEWSVSSVDTQQQASNSVSHLVLVSAGGTNYQWFDDMYINNSSGSVNTTFESTGANFRVKTYAVTSNSSIASTSSGGGSGTYTNIDETIGSYSDADYNYFTSSGTDKFGFADITENVSNVMGVQLWSRAQLSVGSLNLALGTDSSGNLNTETRVPGAGFAWYKTFFPYETGTTAWDKTTVNAALLTIGAA